MRWLCCGWKKKNYLLTGVKCRAASVAKTDDDGEDDENDDDDANDQRVKGAV